jgi:hypothetical protein
MLEETLMHTPAFAIMSTASYSEFSVYHGIVYISYIPQYTENRNIGFLCSLRMCVPQPHMDSCTSGSLRGYS